MSAKEDYSHAYENRHRTGALGAQDIEVMCSKIDKLEAEVEQHKAEKAYPRHAPEAALANYRAGHEVWDTNGDQW